MPITDNFQDVLPQINRPICGGPFDVVRLDAADWRRSRGLYGWWAGDVAVTLKSGGCDHVVGLWPGRPTVSGSRKYGHRTTATGIKGLV